MCNYIHKLTSKLFFHFPPPANPQLKTVPQGSLYSLIFHMKCPQPSFDLFFFSMYLLKSPHSTKTNITL